MVSERGCVIMNCSTPTRPQRLTVWLRLWIIPMTEVSSRRVASGPKNVDFCENCGRRNRGNYARPEAP